MPTLFWLLGLVPLIAGLVLLKLGLWPRRRGDTPYCRRCGYNLTGLSSDRCPECGAPVSPATTVLGERRSSTGKIILGNAIVIIAIVWLAAPLAVMNTWRLYPTFMVIPYLQSPKYTTAKAAWDEIERRAGNKSLSASQLKAVFDRFSRFQLVTRPCITRGDPAVFALWNMTNNSAMPGSIAEVVKVNGLSIDGASQYTCDTGCSLGVGHGELGWPIPFDGSPGKHDLKVTFTVERYYLPGNLASQGFYVYEQGVRLDQRTMTLESSFETFATRPMYDVMLISRPELEDRIRGCIMPEPITFHSDRKDRMSWGVDIAGGLPLNLAFDSFARINGREYPGGSFTVAKARDRMGMGGIRIKYDGPPVESADIILRPSKTAARQTPYMFEIWGGELIYKDVPVKGGGDKPGTRPTTTAASP